ncbi:SGNH/GDSL hydrolase family protein [Niabella aurantiaca]|uniref:SGNH/GDSL hydrolase family protein n=1 Tax=Niabella aurantiaca TaxID=379900 RepID=UPI0003663B2C|nr:GDSL-type esterase/lipase family protein [Niabella aurantiaca]
MKIYLRTLLLLSIAGLSMAGCGTNRPATKQSVKDPLDLTIVTFGNSVTATRKTIKQVFAQRLPSLLSQKGIAATVINSGVPGSHTGRLADNDVIKVKHALERFDTDVLDHHPDLVIVDFGINDAAIDPRKGSSRIPLADYKRNMEYMVTQMQERGINVLLMTPNARGGKQKDLLNKTLSRYVNVVRGLSKTHKTGFVDNFQLFLDYPSKTGKSLDSLLLDGIHPNDTGHEMMADLIVKEIVRMYRRQL